MGGVLQSQPIIPGHVAKWVGNGIVADGGPAAGGSPGTGLSEIGVTNSGIGIQQNSGPITGAYTSLGLGFESGVPTIKVSGNSSVSSLQFDLNGSIYQFPGMGNGDIVGPSTSTVGDIPVFNNTSGTLVKDIPLNLSTSGSSVIATPPSGGLTLNGNNTYTGISTFSGAVNFSSSASIRATGATQAFNMAARFGHVVDIVADFGADPTGTIDSTVAINTALQTPGLKYLAPGTYLVGSGVASGAWALDTNVSSVILIGADVGATTITCTNPNCGVLRFRGNYDGLRDITLDYTGTPTSSALSTLQWQSFYGNLYNIVVNKGYNGIVVTNDNVYGALGSTMQVIKIFGYQNVGLWMQGPQTNAYALNDVYLSQFLFNPSSFAGAFGGIRLSDNVQAFIATDGDIIAGAYSITTASTVNGIARAPSYNKFNNVFCDSGTTGAALLQFLYESSFNNCWFSGGRSADQSTGTGVGCDVEGCNSIFFTGGTQFFNCGGHGCYVNNTSTNIFFTNISAENNSRGATNTYDGIHIAANTTDFVVTNNKSQSGLYSTSWRQRYGVYVETGTSDRYSVSNNLVKGNTTGGVFDGGSGSNKSVTNNWG